MRRAKYPKFRKKGVHDRFILTNDQFSLDGHRIRIPHLGWVRMQEALRFTGKLISATVSRVADRWFISITVAADAIPLRPAENQGATGPHTDSPKACGCPYRDMRKRPESDCLSSIPVLPTSGRTPCTSSPHGSGDDFSACLSKS